MTNNDKAIDKYDTDLAVMLMNAGYEDAANYLLDGPKPESRQALTPPVTGGAVLDDKGRAYPELLSKRENAELLKCAEILWSDLQENKLGGFSGINRPFWILAEFKNIIEKFGKRDVGQNWSKNDLDNHPSAPPSSQTRGG